MENPKILVVDDDELRKCIGQVLRQHGYQVDIADGVLSALALIKIKSYHVILTDKNMPGLYGSSEGGFDIVRYAGKHMPDAKVIMMTGDFTAGMDRRVNELRITDLIFKPFQISTVTEIIEKLIGSRNYPGAESGSCSLKTCS